MYHSHPDEKQIPHFGTLVRMRDDKPPHPSSLLLIHTNRLLNYQKYIYLMLLFPTYLSYYDYIKWHQNLGKNQNFRPNLMSGFFISSEWNMICWSAVYHGGLPAILDCIFAIIRFFMKKLHKIFMMKVLHTCTP